MLYYWLKQVHVWSVLLSFVLFTARSAWVLSGRALPSQPLLVDHILLGSAALRYAPGRGWKAVFFVAAIGASLFMVSVARCRDPLGMAARWLG